MSDINPRVAELCDIIQAAHKELEEIRRDCAHPGYSLVWWNFERPSPSPSRMCDRCANRLPGITDDERAQLGPLFQDRPWQWESR